MRPPIHVLNDQASRSTRTTLLILVLSAKLLHRIAVMSQTTGKKLTPRNAHIKINMISAYALQPFQTWANRLCV